MTNPLVSVTMGTHNRPAWLRTALDSVYAQEMQDFEIILVRDGGCPVDVSMYDDRLSFIDRDENKGFAYSLNEALNYARGRYIAYLGDDDRYYPHHLKTLIEAIEGTDYGVVYSDLYKVFCRVNGDTRSPIKKTNPISRDFDRTMLIHMNHTLGGAMLHRRDLLEKTGMYSHDVKVYIDWDMTRRMSFYTDFLHVPRITGEFWAPVNHPGRISVQGRQDQGEFSDTVNRIKTNNPPQPWADGVEIKGREHLYFDNLYHIAKSFDQTTPAIGARLYLHLKSNYENRNWMSTREADSWLNCGCFVEAYNIIAEVNANMPTTETLEIQGRCQIGMGIYAGELYELIEQIVQGKIYWDNEWKELK